jgi:hypothetical protein
MLAFDVQALAALFRWFRVGKCLERADHWARVFRFFAFRANQVRFPMSGNQETRLVSGDVSWVSGSRIAFPCQLAAGGGETCVLFLSCGITLKLG